MVEALNRQCESDTVVGLRLLHKGERMTATKKWEYTGDASLEYGGTFIDLSTWNDGYCSAVRVTDLDSGFGFTGAALIEHVVINGTDNSERIHRAMQSCGYGADCHRRPSSVPPENHKHNLRLMVADALLSYGHYDPDDLWDGYRSHYSETVQLEPDGPMVFDGWKADKRLRGGDLRGYVEAVHLE